MTLAMTSNLQVGILIMLMWVIVARVGYVLVNIWLGGPTFLSRRGIRTLVVMGSGGHTGEMLKLMQGLDTSNYHPLVYVVANTDKLSRDRLHELDRARENTGDSSEKGVEASEIRDGSTDKTSSSLTREGSGYALRNRRAAKKNCEVDPNSSSIGAFQEKKQFTDSKTDSIKSIIESIPRSREVGQSYVTSVFTTIFATLYAVKVVLKHRPDLVLVNGPGSCIPVCLSALLFRILGVCHGRITFVESLCRVRSLSLTGKILYWIADDFIVQWPQLKEKYPRSKYLGRLV
uniref:UDP-N-acetylglucosamine transferase subunit ALG14 n=1 Tax=Hirondellea gigas TaxID=1518452 RepID=A0A2P2I913_9CRUS